MDPALRLTAILTFCLFAAIAGWIVGRWTLRLISPNVKILCLVAYALWCMSWFPTIVGMLSETPGQPDTPEATTIRVVCAANALLYYVGGSTWLAARSRARHLWMIALAWLPCFFLNSFGPISLLAANAVLNAIQTAQYRQDSKNASS